MKKIKIIIIVMALGLTQSTHSFIGTIYNYVYDTAVAIVDEIMAPDPDFFERAPKKPSVPAETKNQEQTKKPDVPPQKTAVLITKNGPPTPQQNTTQQTSVNNTIPIDAKSLATVTNQSPTNINININNSNATEQKSNSFTTVNPEPSQFSKEKIKEYVESWYARTKDFAQEYKYWIIGSCAALTYAYLYYKVQEGNSYIEQNKLWSSWPNRFDLDELPEFDDEKLTQELLEEIQRRYTQEKNPTDFVAPLTEFMRAIDQETAVLQSYRSFYQWMNIAALSYVLPFHVQSYTSITRRLERLELLKNLFLNWSAHYKLQLNLPQSSREDASVIKRIINKAKKFRSWLF